MSEEPEGPELDSVRRLLAEARHDAPIPEDVAARMDRVLAGLSAERDEAPGTAEVVPLELHRRRRAASLLVAAAAIVVGGVTAVQHLPGGSGSQATAGGTAESDSVIGGPRASGPASAPQIAPGPKDHAGGPLRTLPGRVRVRPGHFAADALSARAAASQTSSQQYDALKGAAAGCVPSVPDAVVLRATYEKAPAALVFHAAAGSTQIVDLYLCGTSKPIRSITLPTP